MKEIRKEILVGINSDWKESQGRSSDPIKLFYDLPPGFPGLFDVRKFTEYDLHIFLCVILH